MADDQSNKRPKKGPEASGEDADALEHEIGHLRQQLRRSDDENARWRKGNHGALAANTFAVVDLSRLDTSLVTHIVSFVGTSRELFDLALTCKAFGWRQPATGLDWPLAEEVARQIVRSGHHDIKGVRVTLSPYVRGTTTWLSILRESERPLRFDTLLGRGIGYANESRTSVRGTRTASSVGLSTAVASNYVMVSGIHYAEFQIAAGTPSIGIVRPIPNLDPDRYANDLFSFFYQSLSFDEFLAARTEEWGSGNVHLCQYITSSGQMSWTSWAGERQLGVTWRGTERCITGDTASMLLNLDKGTLTVYKNNRRLGVMKNGLSGLYCWYATLTGDEKVVTIREGKAPKA